MNDSFEFVPLLDDFDMNFSTAVSPTSRAAYRSGHQLYLLQRQGLAPFLSIVRAPELLSDQIPTVQMFKVSLSCESMGDILKKFVALHEEILTNVKSCRNKDNERGCAIILDYSTSNTFMREGSDSVVDHVERQVQSIRQAVTIFDTISTTKG